MRVFLYDNLIIDGFNGCCNLEQLFTLETGPVVKDGHLVNELYVLLLELHRELLQAFDVVCFPYNSEMAVGNGNDSSRTIFLNILKSYFPKAASLNDGMNALQLVVFLKFGLSYFVFDGSWQVVVQRPVEISLSDLRHCVGAKQSLLVSTLGSDISLDNF